MRASGMRSPEILKLVSDRCVCAPQSRSPGTSMGPKVSFSMRTRGAFSELERDMSAQRLQHLLGVPLRLHLFEDLHDLTLVDDEGRAVILRAPLRLRPHAELIGDLASGIGQEREVQAELVAKCLVARAVVVTYPEDVRLTGEL